MSHFEPKFLPAIPTPDSVFEGAVSSGSTLIFSVPAFVEVSVLCFRIVKDSYLSIPVKYWSRKPELLPALKGFEGVVSAICPPPEICR